MRTIDTTQPLELIDGIFLCVERIGNQLTLRNLTTGDYKNLHVAELTSRLLTPPAMVSLPERSLAALPKPEQEDLSTVAAHLREMETGERAGHDTPRPEYDPATRSLTHRMEAKAAELAGTEFEMSVPTLKRKLKAYRESGAAGLIDRRKQRTFERFDNVDERVYSVMCSIVDDQTNQATGTVARLIRTLGRRLDELYPTDEVPVPSDATLRRRFAELTKGRYTTGKATSRRSRDNTPKRVHKSTIRLLPGAEVQLDSTIMDIEVLGEDGKLTRPCLTIAVDVATRSIVAATLRLDATKGTDHAFLLAQMLTGPQFRPDRSAFRAELNLALINTHRGLKLLTPEVRRPLEEARPFVYPRQITTDNGKDYLSETFRAACVTFESDIVLSAIHTPTDKAVVERMFQTINTLFTMELPGYIGNNPVNRGRRMKDAPLLDIHTLFELFDDWVINCWQNTPNSALRDRLDPSITLTPNQAFAAATDLFGSMPISLDADMFIELLPSDWRAIGAAGIQFDRRFYDCADINKYRRKKSNIPHKDNKWEFKYHPYDPLVIWLRDPDGGWIECRDRKEHLATEPHAGDFQAARREAFRRATAITNAAATGTPMPLPSISETEDTFAPTDPSSETPAPKTTKLTRFNPTKEDQS